MRTMPEAQFEILVDGTPRSYRDTKLTAMGPRIFSDARAGQQGCGEGPANRRSDRGGSQGLMPNFTLLDLSRPEIAAYWRRCSRRALQSSDGRCGIRRSRRARNGGPTSWPIRSPHKITERHARFKDQTRVLPAA